MDKNTGQFEIKYKNLRNYDYMYRLYITSQLGTPQIAEMENCDDETVRRALISLNIPIRSKTDAFKLKNEDDGFCILNRSRFDGIMLGDASIILETGCVLPRFSKKNKFYDHLLHNSKFLFNADASNRIKSVHRESSWEKEKFYNGFQLTSLGNYNLIDEYKRWYVNHLKIIPKDIIITWELLLELFLDDGTDYNSKRPSGSKSVHIEFCTNGFTETEVKFLQKKLFDFGLKFSIVPHSNGPGKSFGAGLVLRLSDRQATYFLDGIGVCPAPSLAYKWKLPEECRVRQIGRIISLEAGGYCYDVIDPKTKKTQDDYLKYEKLLDVNWLKKQYTTKHTKEIQNIVGCRDLITVYKVLAHNNIPIKPAIPIKNDYQIPDEEFFDGCMLSYGKIIPPEAKRGWIFEFIAQTYEHALYIAEKLFPNDPKSRITPLPPDQSLEHKNKKEIYRFYISHPCFENEFKRWYDYNGQKIIPKDLSLTDKSLLELYMTRGSASFASGDNHKKVQIEIATNIFTVTENERLAQKILQLGLKTKVAKKSNGIIRLRISQSDTGRFLETIGAPPLVEFKHKWKLPERP